MHYNALLLLGLLFGCAVTISATSIPWAHFHANHREIRESEAFKVHLPQQENGESTVLHMKKRESPYANGAKIFINNKHQMEIPESHHFSAKLGDVHVRFHFDHKGEVSAWAFGKHGEGHYDVHVNEETVHLEKLEPKPEHDHVGKCSGHDHNMTHDHDHDFHFRDGKVGGVIASMSKRGVEQTGLKPTNDGITYTMRLAVESDFETFTAYGDDLDLLRTNIEESIAEVSSVYLSDLNTKVKIQNLFLYSSSADPWSGASGDGAASALLNEIVAYYSVNDPTRRSLLSDYEIDAYALVTTRNIGGGTNSFVAGLANVDVLCGTRSGSVNRMYTPEQKTSRFKGFVVTVAHELGHTVGSSHTHCYNTPAMAIDGFASVHVDGCQSGETSRGSACFSGAESQPADGGTIMSYCSNIDITFGAEGKHGTNSNRVSLLLRTKIEQAAAAESRCLLREDLSSNSGGSSAAGAAIGVIFLIVFIIVVVCVVCYFLWKSKKFCFAPAASKSTYGGSTSHTTTHAPSPAVHARAAPAPPAAARPAPAPPAAAHAGPPPVNRGARPEPPPKPKITKPLPTPPQH
mmetsp:Transcript_295/g.309  ORF Transcript_295/g.309 Transcript_295/m.309 type:complete len:575 (+) Transcript_295:15-1739(+)